MTFLFRRHDEREGLVLFRIPDFSLVASHVTVLVALLLFSLLLFAFLLVLLVLLLLLLLLRLHGGHSVYRRRLRGLKYCTARPHVRGQLVHLIKVVFCGARMRSVGATTYAPHCGETRRLWRRGPAIVGPPWPVWATGWLWRSSVDYFRSR